MTRGIICRIILDTRHKHWQPYVLSLSNTPQAKQSAQTLFSSEVKPQKYNRFPIRLRFKKRLSSNFDSFINKLSKSVVLTLIPLLLLPYALNSQALSATSAKTIQGTPPYIVLNGVPVTNINELLSIQIGGDTYISDALGNMQKVGTTTKFTDAIVLPNASDTFDSVITPVIPNNIKQSLSTIVPTSDFRDDDGDGNFTFTGDITAVWRDQFNTTVTNLTNQLDICSSNYTLTLTTSGTPKISTVYGFPNVTNYGNNTAVFKIKPQANIKICFAKPNMTYATGIYAGPVDMWNTTRGFIPQATSYQNFPTTGLDGVSFELAIAGASSALTWDPVSVNGITATMTTLGVSSVRVVLKGPQYSSPIASRKPTSTGPWTFLLTGKDSSGVPVVSYGFVLRRWFLKVPSNGDTYLTQRQYCRTTMGGGYRLPLLGELTNASGNTTQSPIHPIPLVTFPSGGNYFTRYIGAGILSEWGSLAALWVGAPRLWAEQSLGTYNATAGDRGYVMDTNAWSGALCVYP